MQIEKMTAKNLRTWVTKLTKLPNKETDEQISDLHHRLKVAENALELAVKNISWCPAKQGECNCQEHNKDCSWFLKRKAEKELKGE